MSVHPAVFTRSKRVLIGDTEDSARELGFRMLLSVLKQYCRDGNVTPDDLSRIDFVAFTAQVFEASPHWQTTDSLLELAEQTAAAKIATEPSYERLAVAIAVHRLHKNTATSWNQYLTDVIELKCLNADFLILARDFSHFIDKTINHERDYALSYFGFCTLRQSYLLKRQNADGPSTIVERPQQMYFRCALDQFLVEYTKLFCRCVVGQKALEVPFTERRQFFEKILHSYTLQSKGFYTHATPTLFNSGFIKCQKSSCFLQTVPDDSLNGIMAALKDTAELIQSSGGIGLDVTCIRAAGAPITKSNGKSNGVVPFLRLWQTLSDVVDQGGGKRNGSIAIYIEPWHLDIFEFLVLKRPSTADSKALRKLFYALWVPDLFMERVAQNQHWTLFCPSQVPDLHDLWGAPFNEAYKTYETVFESKRGDLRGRRVMARDLWAEVLKTQIEAGMPYILFKDRCNELSNQQNLGTIKCSNLCTEVVQYTSKDETAVCNLASIALPKFVVANRFDHAALAAVTREVTRALNRVLDTNFYPIESARRSNQEHRPIGIGVQGLADTFAILGLPFESDEARQLNTQIFETIYFNAASESCKIAQETEPYASFEGSPASQGLLHPFLWHKLAETKFDPTVYTLREWNELAEQVKTHGLANSLLVAPMPTASTAQILGNNESIEAFGTMLGKRRVLSGEHVVINKHLVDRLRGLGVWETVQPKIVANDGSIQNIAEIPQYIRDIFKTVWEIPQRVVIDMAVDRAPYIDQSQSLNLHKNNPTATQLNGMLMHAYQKRLKGGLYYLRTRPAVLPDKPTLMPTQAAVCSKNRNSNSHPDGDSDPSETCQTCSS